MLARLGLVPIALCLSATATAEPAGTPPDEPPIVKRKSLETGKSFREQTYEGGTIEFSPDKLTIAQAYYLFGAGEPPVAENIEVVCVIDTAGRILDYTCTPQGGLAGWPRMLSAATRTKLFSSARTFAPAKVGKNTPSRLVRFSFRGNPQPNPKFDLPAGAPIPSSLLRGFQPEFRDVYPTRALREEAEGNQDFDCAVQADLSVICRPGRFEPSVNSGHFTGVERSLFFQVRVEPLLSDGRSAKGARFPFRVRWRIPHDEINQEAK